MDSSAGPVLEAETPISQVTGNPVLFVTQVANILNINGIASTFGNHLGHIRSAPRDGDLWIRYPDGTLKNLTRAAGYGTEGFQGANSIAVRDHSVHWDGQKALFSMVGSASKQFEVRKYFWQLYKVTGLGKDETPKITKIPYQPTNDNNVSPIFGTDDRIIFTTDRPRSGEAHLYPQRDEDEEVAVVTGLWSLDPANGNLKLLNHAPSGDFTPIIDSYGRVIFTQWDHLQRDQQADADTYDNTNHGTFNYTSEASTASKTTRNEIFPEPRDIRITQVTNINPHLFNQFFPWTILEDGTEDETLNHLGRQELHGYITHSFNDDPNLITYSGQYSRFNQNKINHFFQIKEDPRNKGCYYGTDAPEFRTHVSGQLIGLCAPMGKQTASA